jgi:ABC-2 type transport system ATP-binding protein
VIVADRVGEVIAMPDGSLLECRGLAAGYGGMAVVRDVDLHVGKGEVVALVGPNGAGKTTTLRVILGLVHPTAGRATVTGRLYRQLESPTQQVGAVLEATDFHPGRSGRNHLRVLAAATGIPRSRVEEVLQIVDLQDAAGRRAGGYSLGMRQRLSLAGALLGDPRILVLDEPANGLDPQGIRWLREFLRSLAAEGRTIFISSHVLAEVEQIVDEVVIIHRGKFIEQATTAELVARAAGGIRVRSPQAAELRAALEEAGVTVASSEGDLLTVAEATTAKVGEIAAAKGIVLHELAAESSSLEQAFLDLTSPEGTA